MLLSDLVLARFFKNKSVYFLFYDPASWLKSIPYSGSFPSGVIFMGNLLRQKISPRKPLGLSGCGLLGMRAFTHENHLAQNK